MSQPMLNSPSPDGRGSRVPLLIGVGVIAVALIGFALWSVFGGEAPTAANLEDATAELTDEADEADEADGSDEDTSDTADTTADPATDEADDADTAAGDQDESGDDAADETGDEPATISDVSGDWTVDTSIGEFSFEDSTGTYVGFRIGEELSTVGETEAVGRTPEVTGTVTIDGQMVTATSIEADMTAITTDIGQRDGAARRALGTTEFPTATFVLTEPIDLGADPASGEAVAATAIGDMTIHGVTNPVEVALEAQLVGDTIAVVGSTDVVFADYGVSAPSAPVVVRLDDFGIIEFQLFLTR